MWQSTVHGSWPQKMSWKKFQETILVFLHLPCYWFPTGGCVIDTNTPCLAVMALSAENPLTSIMHSCIPIPESFPCPSWTANTWKRGLVTFFFFFFMHSSQHGVKIKTNYKTEFSESRTIKEKYISPQQEMVRSSIYLSATLHSRMDQEEILTYNLFSQGTGGKKAQNNRKKHRKIQGGICIYLLVRRLSTVQKEEKNGEDRRSKKKLFKEI